MKNQKSPKIQKSPKNVKTSKIVVEKQKPGRKKKEASEKKIIVEIKTNNDDNVVAVPAKKMKLNENETNEIKKEETSLSENNIEVYWKNGVKWVPGKLAWARFGNFPYWPCVVTLDPETMTFHRLMGSFSNYLNNLFNYSCNSFFFNLYNF